MLSTDPQYKPYIEAMNALDDALKNARELPPAPDRLTDETLTHHYNSHKEIMEKIRAYTRQPWASLERVIDTLSDDKKGLNPAYRVYDNNEANITKPWIELYAKSLTLEALRQYDAGWANDPETQRQITALQSELSRPHVELRSQKLLQTLQALHRCFLNFKETREKNYVYLHYALQMTLGMAGLILAVLWLLPTVQLLIAGQITLALLFSQVVPAIIAIEGLFFAALSLYALFQGVYALYQGPHHPKAAQASVSKVHPLTAGLGALCILVGSGILLTHFLGFVTFPGPLLLLIGLASVSLVFGLYWISQATKMFEPKIPTFLAPESSEALSQSPKASPENLLKLGPKPEDKKEDALSPKS